MQKAFIEDAPEVIPWSCHTFLLFARHTNSSEISLLDETNILTIFFRCRGVLWMKLCYTLSMNSENDQITIEQVSSDLLRADLKCRFLRWPAVFHFPQVWTCFSPSWMNERKNRSIRISMNRECRDSIFYPAAHIFLFKRRKKWKPSKK